MGGLEFCNWFLLKKKFATPLYDSQQHYLDSHVFDRYGLNSLLTRQFIAGRTTLGQMTVIFKRLRKIKSKHPASDFIWGLVIRLLFSDIRRRRFSFFSFYFSTISHHNVESYQYVGIYYDIYNNIYMYNIMWAIL